MIPKFFYAEDADKVFNAFATHLENADMRKAFESTRDVLHQGFASNFADTVAPYGSWPPHSPETIRIHGPHPLLILSGKMYKATTTTGAEGNVEKFTAREFTTGVDLFYAPYQQFGTHRKDGAVHIPARPFMWLRPNWIDKVTAEFAEAAFEILVGV